MKRFLLLHNLSTIEEARIEELHILSLCLETNVAIRLVLDSANQSDGTILAEIVLARAENIELRLNELSNHKSRTIRASVFTTLGLLQWWNYLSSQETDSSSKDESNDFVSNAISFYEKSLKQRPSASTYTYLAEALMDQKKQDSANLMLSQALKLSQQHPLAIKLRERLSISPNNHPIDS